MTISPKVSSDARDGIVRLVEKLVARSQRGFTLRGQRVLSDLKDIAQDDLRSNLPGVRQAYLAALRLRIDPAVYEELLDGPLYTVANSSHVEELAQRVADQAAQPDVFDGVALQAELSHIAEFDLGAGIKAVRGAFLATLEEKLPHDGVAYDTLLAGPLAFLATL